MTTGDEQQLYALYAQINEWAKLNRERLIELVSTLVEHDTVNQIVTGQEEQCQHVLSGILTEMGLSTELYNPEEVTGFHEHPAYYPGKDYSNRPNVVAVWKGTGGGKSLLFSSHIDTAVIAPGWEHDPFTPRLEDNRLYGLGSFDMKSGLSASVMAVRCLMELGIKLKGDITIESVVDEEFGGANGTVAGRAKGTAADVAIIPEPTNLAIYPASRGGALWRITFRGTTGLSFSGESIENPANAAAKFIVFLERFEQSRAGIPGPAPWYKDQQDPLPVIVTRLEAGDMQAALCDVGPVECHVDIWVECYPGVTEEDLKSQLLQGYEDFCGKTFADGLSRPEFQRMVRFLPGSAVAEDLPLIPLLASRIESVTGHAAEIMGAPFACDSFVFNQYSSTPAVILGPSGGNAHAPDEFVDLDSLVELVCIYAGIIVRWCGVEDSHAGNCQL
ncbi:M20 family metallopeptidase [Paenibacillus eucommiae]|uniref:Acetylornithine deacetylase n=1 Tax=Paenibacillus eucommiae TaxID=1355755 RepID=A0ABS4JCB2_9BACL|nr:M20/M25/M40 family metallo-hydrolase [Paenibacillus eucommiae]MBP1996871.1 acetylornithine deacetylase [Paenibacillus eucommiae]